MQERAVSLIADTIVTDDGPNLCQQLTSDELDAYLEDAMDIKEDDRCQKSSESGSCGSVEPAPFRDGKLTGVKALSKPDPCEQLTSDELNASLGDAMDMKEDIGIPLGLSVISKRETRQETAI